MKNPLAEVFGYPAHDMSEVARNHRADRLCPFHNSSGLRCTKNSKTDPLGVCTIHAGNTLAITCPVRFRQDRRIVADCKPFFFPPDTTVFPISEVRLKDGEGRAAGNIDLALVAVDGQNRVVDFGAIEIQAVYITGNVTEGFRTYMRDPDSEWEKPWPSANYPKPDYLSSSRKRLVPQLIYKGGILNEWGKKMAVCIHREFLLHLPPLPVVEPEEAEIAWFVYDLQRTNPTGQYALTPPTVLYTRLAGALERISQGPAGEVSTFISELQARVDSGRTWGTPPDPGIAPDVYPPAIADDSAVELP